MLLVVFVMKNVSRLVNELEVEVVFSNNNTVSLCGVGRKFKTLLSSLLRATSCMCVTREEDTQPREIQPNWTRIIEGRPVSMRTIRQ